MVTPGARGCGSHRPAINPSHGAAQGDVGTRDALRGHTRKTHEGVVSGARWSGLPMKPIEFAGSQVRSNKFEDLPGFITSRRDRLIPL